MNKVYCSLCLEEQEVADSSDGLTAFHLGYFNENLTSVLEERHSACGYINIRGSKNLVYKDFRWFIKE